MAGLGIDPHPGTLNLRLEHEADRGALRRILAAPGVPVVPPDPASCRARCYPVRIGGGTPGAIVLPEVDGYPDDQLELIAALPLRQRLALQDGDSLQVAAAGRLRARAVIFDVDGTLVDSLAALRVVAERAAPGLRVDETAVRHTLNTQAPFWEQLLPADTPDRERRIESLKAEAQRLWPEVLRDHARAFPGAGAALAALARAGLRLGIVTGSREGSFEPLRREGLMQFFGAVVTRRDVSVNKPHPEGLLRCVRELGVAPADAVYVGDTPLDVAAAHAAGMAAVAVLSGAGDSALLSDCAPERLIASLAGLSEVVEPS